MKAQFRKPSIVILAAILMAACSDPPRITSPASNPPPPDPPAPQQPANGGGGSLQPPTQPPGKGTTDFGPWPHLVFMSQPCDVRVGEPMTATVRVMFVDAKGAFVATATDSVILSASRAYNFAPSVGRFAVKAVGGIATLRNITIMTTGDFYLAANADGYFSNWSSPFTVGP